MNTNPNNPTNETMMNTRIPLADITPIRNNPVMDLFPQTPFSSPILTSRILPTNTESVYNASTPFFALRRSSSYAADIASAVSTFFDMYPVTLAWYMENYHSQNILRYHLQEDILAHTAHDYLKCNQENIDAACYLIAIRTPVFERVYVLNRSLQACDR